MNGRAEAPAAGTILNALATGFGSAFGIDEYATVTVELDATGTITGEALDKPSADTTLIERCVELCVEHFGDGQGGHVVTESDVPMAAGLKSSSVIANATVLATLDALGVTVIAETHQAAISDGGGEPGLHGSADEVDATSDDPSITKLDATRLGVEAARDANVTVTGAFDDATASMLGGVTVTDNREDDLLKRDEVDWSVLVWSPPKQAFSADVDHERCKRLAPVADEVLDMAMDGNYESAMMMNGLAFCSALGFTCEPIIEALPFTKGVSLSGTGPSFIAVGERSTLEEVKALWELREGSVWITTTVTGGASIL